jgi:hypothetical protein
MSKLPIPFQGQTGSPPSGALQFEEGKLAHHLVPTRQLETLNLLGTSQLWTGTGTKRTQDEPKPVLEATAPQAVASTLELRLFDARANAKLVAARLSMHLPGDWRLKVHKRLDELLDVADWDVDDSLLDPNSMQSFLRFVIYAEVTTVPAIGMSPTGNLVAVWRHPNQRATIEFQPGDRCLALLTETADDEKSIMTFVGTASKAKEFLQREQFALS